MILLCAESVRLEFLKCRHKINNSLNQALAYAGGDFIFEMEAFCGYDDALGDLLGASGLSLARIDLLDVMERKIRIARNEE